MSGGLFFRSSKHVQMLTYQQKVRRRAAAAEASQKVSKGFIRPCKFKGNKNHHAGNSSMLWIGWRLEGTPSPRLPGHAGASSLLQKLKAVVCAFSRWPVLDLKGKPTERTSTPFEGPQSLRITSPWHTWAVGVLGLSSRFPGPAAVPVVPSHQDPSSFGAPKER